VWTRGGEGKGETQSVKKEKGGREAKEIEHIKERHLFTTGNNDSLKKKKKKKTKSGGETLLIQSTKKEVVNGCRYDLVSDAGVEENKNKRCFTESPRYEKCEKGWQNGLRGGWGFGK